MTNFTHLRDRIIRDNANTTWGRVQPLPEMPEMGLEFVKIRVISLRKRGRYWYGTNPVTSRSFRVKAKTRKGAQRIMRRVVPGPHYPQKVG